MEPPIQLGLRLRGFLARLPPEVSLAALGLLVGLSGLAFGLPLLLPDAAGLGFVERHYFRPLFLALGLQLATLAWRRQLRGAAERWPTLLMPVGLIVVTGLVHFNLKAWMPLVHPRLFDEELIRTDYGLGALVTGMIALRRAVAAAGARLGLDVDPLYHNAFVAMFFVSFMAHAVLDSARGFRRVVLGASLVLLLGGLLYWVLPAKGPFVFRTGESHEAMEAQRAMETSFDAFVRTRVPPSGYFIAPLAAMPSLHVGHATLFTSYAWKRVRWLGVVFFVVLVWLAIEAVASGWHYFVDLPAGMALGFGCVWLTERLLPEPERASDGGSARDAA